MLLKRTTWILLTVATILGGAVYLYEGVGSKQREENASTAKRLLPIKSEDEVTAVTLKTAQYTLTLSRTTQPSPTGSPATPRPTPTAISATGKWNVTVLAPQKSEPKLANDATVDFLVNLLVSSDRQPISPDQEAKTVLTIPATQKADFGLTQPTGTLDIQLQGGKSHQLILGQPNFNSAALYAQVDPPAGSTADLQVILAPINFQTALQRPLNEWYPAPASPPAKK